VDLVRSIAQQPWRVTEQEACWKKCGEGSTGYQIQVNYCLKNRRNDLDACLKGVAQGVQGCVKECLNPHTRRGKGELL
jgi:hypothetical protein